MTKVQIHFKLERPLDESLMERVSEAQAIYGIERISLTPDMTGLNVEYDATRLRPLEVEARLRGCGLPVDRVISQ